MTPVEALRAVADEPLRRFFEAVRGLRLEGAEMSLKLGSAGVLPHRVLLGYRRDDLGRRAIDGLCGALGMPAGFVPEIDAALGQADFVHFGFECNVDGWVRKIYLEYRARADAIPASPAQAPVLYDAWKWGGMNVAAAARAQYRRLPDMGAEAALALVFAHYDRASVDPVAQAVGAVVAEAGRRLDGRGLMCLGVTESGNPRTSFDIKLHEAGMRVSALAACLGRLATCFGLPWQELEAAFEAARERRLGHVSGGTDRRGGAFTTFYYDAPELIHGLG